MANPTSFSNLYGTSAGAYSLIHANGAYFTNADVAKAYQKLFAESGPKLDAELLATALDVYATTRSLGGCGRAWRDFRVSNKGLGARSFDIGHDGALFGVPNNTSLNVYEMLQAVNHGAVAGSPYNGNRTLQGNAAAVFEALNDK